MKGWTQEYSSIKRKKDLKVKKNQQVLLAKKLIFYQAMTEKEKKDFLESIQTMFKPKIKEIRPEEELMYTLTRQRELGRRKKRIKL